MDTAKIAIQSHIYFWPQVLQTALSRLLNLGLPSGEVDNNCWGEVRGVKLPRSGKMEKGLAEACSGNLKSLFTENDYPNQNSD